MATLLTQPITSMTRPELMRFFQERNLSAHQARIVFKAMHRLGLRDPAAMSEVSAAGRRFLESLPPPPELQPDAFHRASDATVKLRLKLPSGETIESVIIPTGRRVTLCLSSQAGCAAACTFCHTGTMGLMRNLAAWEIVEQYRIARTFTRRPITNLVFMGMGEPLHNEASVMQACRIFNDDAGAGFSRRHIVLSTAGVGDRMRPVWEENVCSLALSIHATTDKLRDELVPLNRQWNLEALRRIALDIPWRKGDTLMLAYLLLDGINDTREDAMRLAEWSRGLPIKVNLLEFNPFPGTQFKRAGLEKVAAFRQWLHDCGTFHTLRHSRGQDVMAACGQLAVPGESRRGRAGRSLK